LQRSPFGDFGSLQTVGSSFVFQCFTSFLLFVFLF